MENKAPHKLVEESLNLEARSKRISFIGLNPQKVKTRYMLEKESGMGQHTKRESRFVKPGEGTKLVAASPQKKNMDDKREQERMKKMLMSYDISDSQVEELSR